MITSASNQKVKDLIKLRDRSSERRARGLFVVEGPKMVGEISEDRLEAIYVSESFERSGYELPDGFDGHFEVFSDEVFKKISDTVSPQGILALVKIKDLSPLDAAKGGLILVAENIQDPGNLGTMLRSAEAGGADCVICDTKTVDIYSPKVIRSTMGAIFRVPLCVSENLAETVTELKNRGYTAYAAHLKGSTDYREVRYEKASAIMVGNESQGLTDELTAKADCRVFIPMRGEVESLNASVAASLLMFEWVRYF